MTRFYYDFHIHSCLSPCADNDMTPNNIAGMGVLAGLNVMALTDHNSCKNCPAFFGAARANGIVPVAGMELTTAEDIHAVCLFETLEGAMEFDRRIDAGRMKVPNNVSVFGEQLITDGADNVIGQEAFFLPAASNVSIEEAPALAESFGGVCYPAHIDREANGIIAVLGALPPIPGVRCAEFYDSGKRYEYTREYPILNGLRILVSSDAHNLWSIRDKDAFFELDLSPDAPETSVRREIFRLLRGQI
ncbi:MAG: PHP domain-containing protein [Clostridia bacterium]|nr:PHP domain-containing protein [Clostridia bacterium]